MSKIDFNALATLQEKSFTVQKEIDKKCSEGKKPEAQKIALDFMKEVKTLPAIVQMQSCAKGSPMAEMLKLNTQNQDTAHVCDGIKTDFGMPSNQRIQW
jgi:hypothetical protein